MTTFSRFIRDWFLVFFVSGIILIISGWEDYTVRIGWMLIPVGALAALSIQAIRIRKELGLLRKLRNFVDRRLHKAAQEKSREILEGCAEEVRRAAEQLLLLQQYGLKGVRPSENHAMLGEDELSLKYQRAKESLEAGFRLTQRDFYDFWDCLNELRPILDLELPARDWKVFGKPEIPKQEAS